MGQNKDPLNIINEMYNCYNVGFIILIYSGELNEMLSIFYRTFTRHTETKFRFSMFALVVCTP